MTTMKGHNMLNERGKEIILTGLVAQVFAMEAAADAKRGEGSEGPATMGPTVLS